MIACAALVSAFAVVRLMRPFFWYVCTALMKESSWLIACLFRPASIDANAFCSLSVRLLICPVVRFKPEFGFPIRLMRFCTDCVGLAVVDVVVREIDQSRLYGPAASAC